MRIKTLHGLLAAVIQAFYALVLVGLSWALMTDGLRLCIGAACRNP